MMSRTWIFLVSAVIALPTATIGAEADRAAWIANAAYHIRREGRWEYIPYLDSTTKLGGPKDPIWLDEQYVLKQRQVIDALDTNGIKSVSGTRDYQDPSVARANNIYEALKQAGPLGTIVGQNLQSWLQDAAEPYEMRILAQKNRQANQIFMTNSALMTEVLGRVYYKANKDQDYGKFLDVVIGRRFAAAHDQDAKTILDNNPDFAANKLLRQLLQKPNPTETELNAYKKTFLEELENQQKKTETEYKAIGASLKAQDAESAQRAADLSSLLARSSLQAAAEERAAFAQAEANALRSTALVVSTLFKDPDTGRAINAAAQAVAGFRSSIAEFESTQQFLSTRIGSNAAVSIGGAMLTANVLALGIQLAQMTGNKGPTPEEQIFSALQKLHEQIAAFQEEVRGRFDRIDESLNTLYQQAAQNFQTVLTAVQVAGADVKQVKAQAGNISNQIELLERSVTEKLDALLDQHFNNKMVYCLGFAKKNNAKMTDGVFYTCASDIIAYMQDSKQPAYSGGWDYSTDSNSAQVYQRLKSQDWPSQINFFRGLARSYADIDLPGTRANPDRWVNATLAYIKLATENPENFRSFPLTYFDDLYEEGNVLSRELGWTLSREHPERFIKLVRKLVEDYSIAFDNVMNVARSTREQALKEAGSQMLDIAPNKRNGEEVASAIVQRPVLHAKSDSSEWKEREKSGYAKEPWYVGPVLGDASWPAISGNAALWMTALKNVELLRTEAVGIGNLELTYVSYLTDPERPIAVSGISLLGDAQYGKPHIEYVVSIVTVNGARVRLASGTVMLGARILAYKNGGLGPYRPEVTYFDFPAYLKDNSVPFGLPSFKLSDTAEAKAVFDLAEQREVELLKKARSRLRSDLATKATNLNQALTNLDAALLLIRGLMAFAFSNDLTTNDSLRSVLYGNTLARAGGDVVGGLLSSRNASSLLNSTEIDILDTKQWPEPALLRELSSHKDASLGTLLELATFLVNSKTNGNAPVGISDVLGRLVALKALRDSGD